MFVRFVIAAVDPDSGARTGVFQAADRLRRAPYIAAYDAERLTAALSWFGENLEAPTRLSRSRLPHRAPQAICWFKTSASEHLARIRELIQILESYDVPTEMLRGRRPGYVTYEDAHQVAACPFSDTPT